MRFVKPDRIWLKEHSGRGSPLPPWLGIRPTGHMTSQGARAWFRRKVAQLGAALKRLPPDRRTLARPALVKNRLKPTTVRRAAPPRTAHVLGYHSNRGSKDEHPFEI